jgi:hypothetical protein
MRELVLIQPGRVLVGRSEREEESSRSHREFEERLAECGPQDGQTIQSTMATDPLSGKVLAINVTMNVVK